MNPYDQARQVGVVDSHLAQYYNSSGADNPVATTVLADTGQLAAGYYDVDFYCAHAMALAADNFQFQWRNVLNSGNLAWWEVIEGASITFKLSYRNLLVAQNERFRTYCVAGLTGRITTVIVAVRRV